MRGSNEKKISRSFDAEIVFAPFHNRTSVPTYLPTTTYTAGCRRRRNNNNNYYLFRARGYTHVLSVLFKRTFYNSFLL